MPEKILQHVYLFLLTGDLILIEVTSEEDNNSDWCFNISLQEVVRADNTKLVAELMEYLGPL